MMTKQHLIYQVSIMIIIGTLLFGCSKFIPTPLPEQMDKSPFTGIPCAAPCWRGLVIGKSSESEVRSTIPNLTFIDQKSVYYHRMPSMSTFENPSVFGEGLEITANCINSRELCLTIQVVGNILTDISIELNYQINVDAAIKYLDKPDYIGYDRESGEQITCQVYLIWSEKELALKSKIFEGPNAAEKNCFVINDSGKISSSLLVSEVEFMSPAAIKTLQPEATNAFFKFTGTSP